MTRVYRFVFRILKNLSLRTTNVDKWVCLQLLIQNTTLVEKKKKSLVILGFKMHKRKNNERITNLGSCGNWDRNSKCDIGLGCHRSIWFTTFFFLSRSLSQIQLVDKADSYVFKVELHAIWPEYASIELFDSENFFWMTDCIQPITP